MRHDACTDGLSFEAVRLHHARVAGAWVGCNERCLYRAKVVGRLMNLEVRLVRGAEGNLLVSEKPGPWFLPPGPYEVTFISEVPGETSFEEQARCSAGIEVTPNTAGLAVSVLFRSTTCEIHITDAIVD